MCPQSSRKIKSGRILNKTKKKRVCVPLRDCPLKHTILFMPKRPLLSFCSLRNKNNTPERRSGISSKTVRSVEKRTPESKHGICTPCRSGLLHHLAKLLKILRDAHLGGAGAMRLCKVEHSFRVSLRCGRKGLKMLRLALNDHESIQKQNFSSDTTPTVTSHETVGGHNNRHPCDTLKSLLQRLPRQSQERRMQQLQPRNP